MRVSDVQKIEKGNTVKLIAAIESDVFNNFSLWYRFPNSLAEYIHPDNGDPFVAALLLPSMMLGEDLEIGMPVSAKLFQSIRKIQQFYQLLSADYSKIEVKVKEKRPSPEISRRSSIGLFFSLGVDSYYSLLRNQNDSVENSDKITNLIVVEGFDLSAMKGNLHLLQDVLNNSAKPARQFNLNLTPIATNVRELIRLSSTPWHHAYGAALASIALHMQEYFTRCFIASGDSGREILDGSDPLLDPLWSTESLAIIHDGIETRIEKIAYISDTPIVGETLRICQNNFDGKYNCGRCEKCLRTMIALSVLGRLGNVVTLPPDIRPEAIRSISLKDKRATIDFRKLAKLAEEEGKSDLARNLKALLRRERLVYHPRRMIRAARQSLRKIAKT